ncbi:MAG TPA: hypothetical protein VM536_17345 [Chloroflexia bacterium]|nr:hypothetical protein [Chloroflexia bacterium]
MDPNRPPERAPETVRIAPATANRVNEGVIRTSAQRANDAVRISPLEQASRMPLLPTSRPARVARRTGPINPVYLVLVAVVPLVLLGTMVWAAAALFPPPSRPEPGVMVQITPANEFGHSMVLDYKKTNDPSYRRENDWVFVTGRLQNNSQQVVHGVFLKAFFYRKDALGGAELVGTGIGSTAGDIPPGGTADFVVPGQLTGGPVPKEGTATPPRDYETVDVQVDQVWTDPTPVPKQ